MTSGLTPQQWQAVERLVLDGTLTAEQAAAVRAGIQAAGAEERRTPRAWLAEAAGYLGGALTLAGAALLVGLSWDDLSRAWRVAVLAAVTALLIAVGVAVAGGPAALRAMATASSTTRRRVVSVLLAMSAGTAALAAGAAVQDYQAVVGGLSGLALAAAGYAVLPSLPSLLTAAALSMVAAMATVYDLNEGTSLAAGLAVTALGVGWAALGLSGITAHRTAAVTVGAAIALAGAQLPLGGAGTAAWAYLLTLLVAAGSLAVYALDRTALLLAAGVIGVTLAVAEAVADWTNGAAGGAAAILTAGAVLLLGSALAMRVHRHQDQSA